MNLLELLIPVTTFVFDVDGVLTDGSLLVLPNGLMARRMNIKDGYALQLAVRKGYHVLVISGGNSPEVQERLFKLGVRHVFMQVENKKKLLEEFMQHNALAFNEILFMGDDIPDYDVMSIVGVPCCPSDAVPEIRQISKYISPVNGGYGCARDIIEKVLRLRNDWGVDTHIKSQ